MGNRTIVQSTTNRGEFNRAYKEHLERVGKIHCSRCPYNRNENDKRKWYGGFGEKRVKQPNWKLVSKNPKQWMGKPVKIVENNRIEHRTTYITIKF